MVPHKKRKAVILHLGIAAFILFLCLMFGSGRVSAENKRKKKEPKTSLTQTNTDSIYSEDQFMEMLEDYSFDDVAGSDKILEASYVVPGLKATRTLKGKGKITMCTSMVPQGVCVADSYVLISAYCASKKHNSVLYVLDKETHEFVKEIVLKGKPHVGGITYDPEHQNVWICGFKKSVKEAYVHVVSLDSIRNYDLGKMKVPVVWTSYPVYSVDRASFIDYNDGAIYIGTFTKKKDDLSTIQCFDVKKDGTPRVLSDYSEKDLQEAVRDILAVEDDAESMADDYLWYGEAKPQNKLKISRKEIQEALEDIDDNTLVPQDVSLISGKIQGFTADSDYSAMSQSGGRTDSRLYIFKNRNDFSDVLKTTDEAEERYTLPPMLEQIADADGKLYLCFESAAYIYRNRSNAKVDRIIVLDE